MDPALSRALARVADGLAAMAAGNPGPYVACWADSADVTLFAAWGPIEKGHHAVARTFEWVGSRFSDGELVPRYEVVDVSGDLAYTVGLEQGTVRIDGGEARPMTLRVTHVYRRIEDDWWLVHRHADSHPSTSSADSVPLQGPAASPWAIGGRGSSHEEWGGRGPSPLGDRGPPPAATAARRDIRCNVVPVQSSRAPSVAQAECTT